MRLFYVIAAVLAVLLTASPLLLPREDTAWLKGKLVAYSTYGAKVRSLDPATCGDTTSASIQGNVYESLYAYHYLNRPIEVIPQLADGMPEVSPDGLTYTVRIKRGVRYCRNACFGLEADGRTPRTRELKADDFVLAFKRIVDYHMTTPMSFAFIEDKLVGIKEFRDKTQGYQKGDFSRYDLPFEGVQAVDDHTVRFKLAEPFPQLLYVLAISCYAPVPREMVDYWLATRDGGSLGRVQLPAGERSPQITDFQAAVGTGAYRLRKFVDGGDIVLERNPDFRGDVYPSEGAPGDREAGLLQDAGRKVPFIDVSYMTFVQDENPAWMLFVTRQTDMSGIPSQMYTQVISPTKQLTDAWAQQGIRLLKHTDPAIYWYVFNMEDPVLGKSKSLRQALCLAFHVEDYIEVIFNGRAIRSLTYVPSSFEAFQEAGPSPYARFDLKAAKEKLAAARKELEAAGVLKPGEDFPPLTLDLPGMDEMERRVGEFAIQQFKPLGLTLKIELNDWPTLQAKVENKRCQIYAMGWHADYPDPENFLQLFYSPNIKRGTNNANYTNPEFDALYEQAAKMMPSPQRTALYAQALKILNEDCPVLLLEEPIGLTLLHDWVQNIKPHPIGYGFLKYHNIDAALRKKEGGRQ